MGAVSTALARAARENGAELRTLAEVTRLDAGDGGVEITFLERDREHTVRAGHALADVAPDELDRLRGHTRRSPPEGSQLKVNMLLARLPRVRDPAVAPRRAFCGTFHANE